MSARKPKATITHFQRKSQEPMCATIIFSLESVNRAGEPARFDRHEPTLSKLFERRGAEIRVEPLAIDRNGLEFAQVCPTGYLVVLVALIPFQWAQFNPFDAALEEVRVVVRVFDCDEDDMDIRSVRRLEVCQPE